MNLSAWIPEEAPELSPSAYAQQQAMAVAELPAEAMAAELARVLGDDRVAGALLPMAEHLRECSVLDDPLEVVEELLLRLPEPQVRGHLMALAYDYGAARLKERQA